VYDAGYAAGMSFPFPQREVRLLRDAPAESAAPSPQTGAATEEAGGDGRAGTDAR
jgi:hypothetical protein